MKILTLLICVFSLFALNEALDKYKEDLNFEEVQKLIKQLKGTTEKYTLYCKIYMEYCNNKTDIPENLKDVCPVIFKAYLCDKISSPYEMIKVLQEYDIENQDRS